VGQVKVVLSAAPAPSEMTVKNVLPDVDVLVLSEKTAKSAPLGVDVLVQIGKAAKNVLPDVGVLVLKALQEPSAMIVLHLLDARLVVDAAVQKDHVHLVEMKEPDPHSANVLLASVAVAALQSSADLKRLRVV
jgi:hypothetical protein